MLMRALPLCVGAALLALSGCSSGEGNEASGQSEAATKAGGDKTIAAGLDQNGRFFQAARSVGLDATLGGAEPYTVLVPDDAALASLPTGADAAPQDRSRVTGVLTNHILPGIILAEDIGKAIDIGKGKAPLVTMGGGTITATREGDKIVFTDAAGGKATVNKADEKFTNGVVHRISGVLQPQGGQAAPQQPVG